MNILKSLIYKLLGEVPTSELLKRGMQVGRNFHRMNGVWIDPGHCWLICMGNDVTLAPRVTILAHDASPQTFLHFTKIGNVEIGDKVFIGAGAIILPGVKIGSNVIIGAGSVVTNNIPENSICAGNPCRHIMKIDEYLNKIGTINKEYGSEYLYGNISDTLKAEMRSYLFTSRFAKLIRKQ